MCAVAPLFLVFTEKGKEEKTPLFFKTCFPSVRVSVVEEIHSSLHPAEIKAYQDQAEWDFEQFDVVKGVPDHGRGLELDDV